MRTNCSESELGSSPPAMETNFSSLQLQGFASSWPSLAEGIGNDVRVAAAASSSKSHSEAEKRRRDRINGQLLALRKLTPNSEKMDKAALLTSVIQRVKDLQIKSAEVRKAFTVPSDVDEVLISTAENNCGRNICIEVCICCEDRPELFTELVKTLQSLKLSIVRAEMATLGCRVQIALLLSSNGIKTDDGSENWDLRLFNLKRTLRACFNRVLSSTPSVSSHRVASKRQRFFFTQADTI